MLSKIIFRPNFKSINVCSRSLMNVNNNFRVVENENQVDASNEQFKYKTQASENVLSSSRNAERLTSFVENIQVLPTTEFAKNQLDTMSEVSRDRLGQWPFESESELSGQGLQRLKNGRFNKVSPKRKRNIFKTEKSIESFRRRLRCCEKNYETKKCPSLLIRKSFVANRQQF